MMKYIITTIFLLMTVSHVVCGVLLWKRRSETGDYSRTIQAVLSWISAFFTFTFVFRTWGDTTVVDGAFFEPEPTFVPLLIQMSFFLYPLEVIRPTIGRVRAYALLFTPLFLLVIVGMCAGIEYTPIYTYSDLWQHIGEFNIWFRLFALTIMLFYCFSLLLVPYDWRHSSVDKKFIMRYALGFCLFGILHFSIQFSHAYYLVILHQIVWMLFFVFIAHYELNERLLVSEVMVENDNVNELKSVDKLWEEIILLLDSNDKWRNPDLSLTSLTEQLESNRTYVSDAFKRNTGMTFIEYITHRRINYVATEMKGNQQANMQELFNYVGYRQRSTAWRNFQKITGMTPTEFVNSLRSKKCNRDCQL